MPPLTARFLLEVVAAIGTICSLVFYFLSGAGLASYLRSVREKNGKGPLPPVSILKPLKGVDPEILESFRSHCDQQYGEYELIFGVSDPADPACEVVRKLQAEYSARPIKLVICDRILGTNVKVSNLVQMLAEARHEILLVNDSDVRVAANYLKQVVAPLADQEVGLVTCLYRAEPERTLGSRLEALGISTDFVPGVLSARLLEGGLHFGLGSTLVFRRQDLAAIGGFEVLLDYLGDDYELGKRIAASGKRVELSAATVVTFLPAYRLSQFFQHQLRWARTIRDARPWGYLGLILTFGLPWAVATVAVAGGAAWACALFVVTLAARVAVGLGTALLALDDRGALRNILLLPLRDLTALVVWGAGLVGKRIHWRGDDFILKDGRLTRTEPT